MSSSASPSISAREQPASDLPLVATILRGLDPVPKIKPFNKLHKQQENDVDESDSDESDVDLNNSNENSLNENDFDANNVDKKHPDEDLQQLVRTYFEEASKAHLQTHRVPRIFVGIFTWIFDTVFAVTDGVQKLVGIFKQRNRNPPSSKPSSEPSSPPPIRTILEPPSLSHDGRKWALWLICIIPVGIAYYGGWIQALRQLGQDPSFSMRHNENIKRGRRLKMRAEKDLKALKQLRFLLVGRIRSTLNDINFQQIRTGSDDFNTQFQAFEEASRKVDFIEARIAALEDKIQKIEETAETQQSMEVSNYKGLAEWAKESLDTYDGMLNALIAFSILGLGLVYTSLFSATRGNLGLMSWAFALLLATLFSSTVLQIFLRSYSRLDYYPFNPNVWPLLLEYGFAFAITSTGAAFLMLAVTVYLLNYPELAPSPNIRPIISILATLANTTYSSQATGDGSSPDFSVSSKPPVQVIFWVSIVSIVKFYVMSRIFPSALGVKGPVAGKRRRRVVTRRLKTLDDYQDQEDVAYVVKLAKLRNDKVKDLEALRKQYDSSPTV